MFKLFLVALIATCALAQELVPSSCNFVCQSAGATCYPFVSTATYVCVPGTCELDFSNVTAITGVCAAVEYTAVGANCTITSTCATGSVCSAGVCTTVTFTAAVGQACSSAAQCANDNLFCSASTQQCAAKPTTGACTTSAGCAGANVCNSGTCVVVGSIAIGGGCSDDDACAAGAFCSKSGTCKATFTSSGRTCSFSNTTFCGEDETCGCVSYKSGQSTCQAKTQNSKDQATLDKYKAALSCFQTNNCNTNYAITACTSCKNEACAFYTSQASLYSALPTCLLPAEVNQITTFCAGATNTGAVGTTSSAATVAVPLVLLATAAAFVL